MIIWCLKLISISFFISFYGVSNAVNWDCETLLAHLNGPKIILNAIDLLNLYEKCQQENYEVIKRIPFEDEGIRYKRNYDVEENTYKKPNVRYLTLNNDESWLNWNPFKKLWFKRNPFNAEGIRFKKNPFETEGIRFKKYVYNGEGIRFKRSSNIFGDEGVRYKKSPFNEEGIRFKKSPFMEEEGVRYKKNPNSNLNIENKFSTFETGVKSLPFFGETVRFKKLPFNEEGIRFKKSPFNEEGIRFKKSPFNEEGIRFKKSPFNEEGIRFKKSPFNEEGIRFKKSVEESAEI